MPAFVTQGLEQSAPVDIIQEPALEYPHIYDEEGFSIDMVPSTKFYQSYDRDGHALIYSGSHWECEFWTRQWLKARQDGEWTEPTRTLNDGTVGGKL